MSYRNVPVIVINVPDQLPWRLTLPNKRRATLRQRPAPGLEIPVHDAPGPDAIGRLVSVEHVYRVIRVETAEMGRLDIHLTAVPVRSRIITTL